MSRETSREQVIKWKKEKGGETLIECMIKKEQVKLKERQYVKKVSEKR